MLSVEKLISFMYEPLQVSAKEAFKASAEATAVVSKLDNFDTLVILVICTHHVIMSINAFCGNVCTVGLYDENNLRPQHQ